MRKIYDCFTFFNELDLLELRLEEHYDYVDHFVIAEASKSHQGFDKPFYLENNWDRYAKYHDKIIYIKVEDMPTGGSWTLENHQRNALSRGLVDAAPNDVVVVSDCDELLRGSTFDLIRNDTFRSMWICRQPIFWLRLNYLQVNPAGYNVNSMAVVKSELISPQDLRNKTWWAFTQVPMEHVDGTVRTIQHAGWHFSFLGDNEHVKHKLLNFAHTEARHHAENLDIEQLIQEKRSWDPGVQFDSVVIDDYFPKTIINNLERWNKDIVPNATTYLKDLLPLYGQT
jgi:hypothetical protein